MNMARKTLPRMWVAVAAVLSTFAIATPAYAADTWTYSDYHVGDLCTTSGPSSITGCDGSASFVKYGDHLYVWDNVADGHSVVVRYGRSDYCGVFGCPIQFEAWNHYGAGTRIDHNMDIPENGWINYQVCIGEYSTGEYWRCSNQKLENAS